ncbi:hypothetical protein [Spirosoma radiotolerans]|uniref:Outer membrane protein beta-barrel domain-containing protein n=1 Tax=Spirosoma radiotolerans TaxID=1379870 RepID=A0A0E3V755_9BACT|nr:hypothetical protein [Spirosoma radiotolerans]AKD55116.1 hypothetical protein SD10_09565 [Spirosoma radiotolerans]
MKNQPLQLLVLIGLLVRVSATQAQPAVNATSVNRTDESAITETAPRQAKATESSVYIKAYGFYSLLTPGTQINYNYSQSQSSLPNSYQPVKTRLGQGPRAGIGLGLIASDFINVGIDADLLFGTALTTNYDVFVGSDSNLSRYVISNTTTLKVLSVIPSVTFKALSRPSYYIYNRLGLVGGIVLEYKTIDNRLETPTKGASTTSIGTANYTKNSLAIGYQAALGIQFRLSQAIRGFVEVVAYNQSFKPKEIQSTTVSTKSGISTTQSSTTEYKSQGDFNKSDPSEQPNFNVAINSVGAGAGLVVRF